MLSEPFDPQNPGPFLTVRFQYRARGDLTFCFISSDCRVDYVSEFLQAMGIIPPPKQEENVNPPRILKREPQTNLQILSDFGMKAEPSTTETLNDGSELASLREQVARLRNDMYQLKKRLSKAKDAKKAHSLIRKGKQHRGTLDSDDVIDLDLVDSDIEDSAIVIDLCSE